MRSLLHSLNFNQWKYDFFFVFCFGQCLNNLGGVHDRKGDKTKNKSQSDKRKNRQKPIQLFFL